MLFSTLSGLQSENTSLKVENVDLTGNISLRKDVLLYLKMSNYYLLVPCYVTIFDSFYIKNRKYREILKQKFKRNCLINCKGLILSLRFSFMTVYIWWSAEKFSVVQWNGIQHMSTGSCFILYDFFWKCLTYLFMFSLLNAICLALAGHGDSKRVNKFSNC